MRLGLSDKTFYGLLLLVIITNALGLTNEILGPDGLLYANISKTMVLQHDWLNIYVNGQDWLDKPHLPFWLTALSFKLFGFTAFAYKLPGFLCSMAALYYVYKLGVLVYNKAVARIAVLMCGSGLHLVLANFDVRAEPYLTLFIIAAVFYLFKAETGYRFRYILLASLAAAAAVITKGIFALLIIGSGFLFYYISLRNIALLFRWRWVWFGALTLLFMLPELYSLWVQFDQHPEKTVFGTQGVSGIRFFFWDSQFGRFFNSGPIKGNSEPSFFIHTTLWAFLPWSFMLVAAVWQYRKKANHTRPEHIITGSALVTFLLFSLSGFQLSHYIVVLIPHFSLMAAQYLAALQKPGTLKGWKIFLNVLLVIVVGFVWWIGYFSQFGGQWHARLAVLLLAGLGFVYRFGHPLQQVITKGVLFTATLFYFLNLYFYPSLLQYQSGMMAARQLNNQWRGEPAYVIAADPLIYLGFEFYANFPVVFRPHYNFRHKGPVYIFTTEKDLVTLTAAGYSYRVVSRFDEFHVSVLTGDFLNKDTRPSAVTKTALVLLSPKGAEERNVTWNR